MVNTVQERRDLEVGRNTKRFGIPALLMSAVVSFLLGWFGGQAAETNNADNVPGGNSTDNVRGPSPSDTK